MFRPGGMMNTSFGASSTSFGTLSTNSGTPYTIFGTLSTTFGHPSNTNLSHTTFTDTASFSLVDRTALVCIPGVEEGNGIPCVVHTTDKEQLQHQLQQ